MTVIRNFGMLICLMLNLLEIISFTGRGLSEWDVSNVYTMNSIFKGTRRYVPFLLKFSSSALLSLSHL